MARKKQRGFFMPVKTKGRSKASTVPAKRGRPKDSTAPWRKGETRYHPSVCEKVINLMKKGYSQDVISAHLGITINVFHKWMNKGEFRMAVEEGKKYSQLWWETQGIRAVQGEIKGFNSAVWIFNMKNRFGWRDKQEITGDEDKPISVRVVKFSNMQPEEKVVSAEWKKEEEPKQLQ